jgi:ATP-dependent Clp protease ATP-binding subunit ClpA|tara:strand:+ start:1410 stop:2744 length:1335 start_codon:yes stop_codon:yes gene_type:complete
MTSKTFKLFCKELDEIISVKSYSHQDEATIYEKFKLYLSNVPTSYDVKHYKKKVVDSLLVDASSYYTFLDTEVEEALQIEIITALYDTVLEAYPHFEFEFICNDINSTIAFDHMRQLFTKHLADLAPQKAEPKVKSLKSYSDLTRLSKKLRKSVIGQDEACDKTINAIKLILADIDDFSSFFYIGPTGVGKTKLAKVLGENYSGNFFKVNCGEYSAAHDYAKLIGAPPGYVGHSESSLLGEKAAESNSWVILFDEIEKANSKFYDFLLSLLDDGTCTDNLGNTLDFSKSIFIFTTNEGIQDNNLGSRKLGFEKECFTYEENKDSIMESIKRKFSPEFLNRIDNFIFFNRLGSESLKKIVKLEMNHLPIKKNTTVTDYIINNSNHTEYGARNIAKFIKTNISILVADAVLKKQIPINGNKYYTLKVINDDLIISNIQEASDGRQN